MKKKRLVSSRTSKSKKNQAKFNPRQTWIGIVLLVIFLFLLLQLITSTPKIQVEGASLFNKVFRSKITPTVTSRLSGGSGSLTALPLGDKKYASSPQKGYIYPCQTNFVSSNTAGAHAAGPWINQTAGTWDLTKKITVDGEVVWPTANTKFTLSGSSRIISGNGLPNHKTGTYPISSSDDAYAYDRNPNSIKSGTITLTLPANPTLLTTPECAGGSVGIMLSGIPIYNGFDAGGRDAMAWEVQDNCDGHPQSAGQYHYHGLSKCVKDSSSANSHSALLGYALDGFGIYGVRGEKGVQLWTKDLDECHGHTHTISWDGVSKSMYHYHMTYDFPYSIGCFRAKKAARTVGAAEGMQQQGGAGASGILRPSGKMPRPSGSKPDVPPPGF